MNTAPISFSPVMVRALLARRKVQTRRLAWETNKAKGKRAERKPSGWQKARPGVRLWVREKFLPDPNCDHAAWDTWRMSYQEWCDRGCRPAEVPEHMRSAGSVIFAADPKWEGYGGIGWHRARHMPRWASRITLEVTEVRRQRLTEITDADALAEGVGHMAVDGEPLSIPLTDDIYAGFLQLKWGTPRNAFVRLWEGIHGPDSFATDPEVVVIGFEVRHANIDTLPMRREAA